MASTRKRTGWSVVLLAISTFVAVALAAARSDSSAVPPQRTLERMTFALSSLGEALCSAWQVPPGDSLLLAVDSANDGWIADQALAKTFRSRGYRVLSSRDSSLLPARAFFRITRLSVRYTDLNREGLFGGKSVTRTVDAEVSYRFFRRSTNVLADNGLRDTSVSDTVRLEEVPMLESAGIARTIAPAPQETFLDRAVEPFLILGAAGLAVYLLFHIRS